MKVVTPSGDYLILSLGSRDHVVCVDQTQGLLHVQHELSLPTPRSLI